MAKDKANKKKTAKDSNKQEGRQIKTVSTKKKLAPTVSRKEQTKSVQNLDLIFGKETFKWMAIGVAIMAAGFIAMLGGHNEDPNVWDENVIYNWRITILAPILLLTGLGLQIYAIFKK